MPALGSIARVLLVAVLVYALAMVARTQLIEPDAVGRLCTAASAPSWCALRQALVMGFVHNVYGWLSVGAALLAAVTGWRGLAWPGLVAGVVGGVLYRFDPAGAGVLLAALLLARGAHPRVQNGQRESGAR
ncbi:MAG: hypothetical protein NFCOHLIN_02788 [Gammaproteobacteria bacterium]|nr:hypothetical protein [Gammaproteobacteria bacterium]